MTLAFPRVDVGLGTAYERVAIYHLFERWAKNRYIETALEGPIDGMAGIPGLHLLGLARKGTRVTVALPDTAALDIVRAIYRLQGVEDRLTTLEILGDESTLPGNYDLVLTYNALPLVGDWRSYLERLAKRASRFLLVSVTNPYSYGVGIRKLQRLMESAREPELFDHDSVRPSVLGPFLERFGRVVEHEHLDSPWWPDLFVPTGQTLAGATLRRLPIVGKWIAERSPSAGPQRHGAPERYLYGRDRFPLFEDGPGYEELAAGLKHHPVFDGKGALLGRLFGHHHAYLIQNH
jgi:hypothetical protein